MNSCYNFQLPAPSNMCFLVDNSAQKPPVSVPKQPVGGSWYVLVYLFNLVHTCDRAHPLTTFKGSCVGHMVYPALLRAAALPHVAPLRPSFCSPRRPAPMAPTARLCSSSEARFMFFNSAFLGRTWSTGRRLRATSRLGGQTVDVVARHRRVECLLGARKPLEVGRDLEEVTSK